jgi:hypothetical protein
VTPPLPRFALLDGRLPDAAAAAIRGTCEVVGAAAAEDADGALLLGGSDAVATVREYRAAGGRLPVYVLVEGEVPMADRLAWIRHGADDLLSLDTLGEALARKARSASARPVPGAAGPRLDRWLRASARYLAAREELLAELGPAGRGRYLDVAFLRDQVLRASEFDGGPDLFGQRRGSEREALDWPARLVSPSPGEALVLDVGADGARLSLPVAPGPDERVSVVVSGEHVTGRLDFEVRWQRRIGRGRWQVGVVCTACVLEP